MAKAGRSLGQALSLTPDKMAFINGGVAAQESGDVSDPSEGQELSNLSGFTDKEPPKPPTPRSRIRQRDELKSHQFTRDAQEGIGFMTPILVPLNTRLHPQTADTLRRACLEQRLQRKLPFTQQQIVELAVQAWLRKNGFLKPDE